MRYLTLLFQEEYLINMQLSKRITSIVAGVVFAFFVASPVMSIVSPQVSSVAARGCEDKFLGIPPWYRGLTANAYPDCTMKSPSSSGMTLQSYIWAIVLNVIEMAVVAVAYVSAFFILYGGFQFITGGSSPDTVTKARKTITNAVIGLIIAMGSIAIINLIFNSLFK